MIDQDLADSIKDIATKYGMTIASYLRALFKVVIEAEAKGYYAPLALARALMLLSIFKMGYIVFPMELIGDSEPDKARNAGRKLAQTLVSLKYDPRDLVHLFSDSLPFVMVESDRIIILKTSLKGRDMLSEFISGFIESLGYKKRVEGDIIVFEQHGG